MNYFQIGVIIAKSFLKEIDIKNRVRLNREIRAPKLRLIDVDGTQLGIVAIEEALAAAEAKGFDLAEISPNTDPPVAKLIDWGKYQYEKEKQAAKSRKKQKNIELKQVRIGLKTDKHDIEVKQRAAIKFLEHGNKVKVNLRFRGREITHPQLGQAILENFYQAFEEIADKEQEPTLSGRELSMILVRRKDAKTQNSQDDSQTSQA